jgi:hypothetical protein
MRKILIIAMLLMLLMPFAIAAPDPYKMLRGQQMVTAPGAPWISDDAKFYLGTGKDASISYDDQMDKLYLNDTALYLEEDVTVAGVLTASGGTVNSGVYDGNFRLAANHWFYSTTGTGGLNFANATGFFNTTTGTNYLNGNTQIPSDKTFKAGGLATVANLKSNATGYFVTTLNSGGTATMNAVVSNTTVLAAADGIRANSIILPGEMVINVIVTKGDFAAGELNRTVFVADDAWTITSIEEVHSVAETTATTLPLSVQKMTGAQALTGGINITNGALNLKSTANTVVTATLSTTSGRTTLADGNRIGIICNLTGTNVMGEFRGGLVTIHLKRV